MLISTAGPARNGVLVSAAVILAKLLLLAEQDGLAGFAVKLAVIRLFLCFFNLLPVPPLDGSHALKHAISMSNEHHMALGRYGFLLVILLIQIPFVRVALAVATGGTLRLMARRLGL